MDDTLYGVRSATGEWTPHRRASYSPLFGWPTKPLRILRWIVAVPGFLASSQGTPAARLVGLGRRGAFDVIGFAHYLHHKYFEVNYADGSLPLDRWFGSFHDGSPEAHALMKQRLAVRNVSS
jgi:hypothetical protein